MRTPTLSTARPHRATNLAGRQPPSSRTVPRSPIPRPHSSASPRGGVAHAKGALRHTPQIVGACRSAGALATLGARGSSAAPRSARTSDRTPRTASGRRAAVGPLREAGVGFGSFSEPAPRRTSHASSRRSAPDRDRPWRLPAPAALYAQQGQGFAAEGIPTVPLPDAPVVYDTAAGQRIRVSVVAEGLTYPWGPRVPARWPHPRHRAAGHAAADPGRRPRSGPARRHSRGLHRGSARGADGRGGASAVRREPLRVPHLLQAHGGRLYRRPRAAARFEGGAPVGGPRRLRGRRRPERRRVAARVCAGRVAST